MKMTALINDFKKLFSSSSYFLRKNLVQLIYVSVILIIVEVIYMVILYMAADTVFKTNGSIDLLIEETFNGFTLKELVFIRLRY